MEPLNQISLAFSEGSTTEQQAIPVQEEQPVNVGIRIKALKQNAAPVAESTVPEPVAAATEKNKKVKSTRGRKSIKQVEAEADLIEIPEDEVLFLKQYYSMGEVAEMFRVNHSLLRFWENEFDIIQPRKNRKGDRYFRPIDIKNLHLIYHLLRQRKYTIEGAKDFLKNGKKAEAKFETIRKLQQVKNFLLELKASL
jgi:DNA-binding transcriptional MerR regulator